MIYWLLALGALGGLLVPSVPSVEKASTPISYLDPRASDALLPLPPVAHLDSIPWLATPPQPRPKVDLLLGPAVDVVGPSIVWQAHDDETIAAARRASEASLR
jgi:hypothetical protein